MLLIRPCFYTYINDIILYILVKEMSRKWVTQILRKLWKVEIFVMITTWDLILEHGFILNPQILRLRVEGWGLEVTNRIQSLGFGVRELKKGVWFIFCYFYLSNFTSPQENVSLFLMSWFFLTSIILIDFFFKVWLKLSVIFRWKIVVRFE